MTRQQHHAEGERLLALAETGDMERDDMRDRLIRAATAHALLALFTPDGAASGDVPGVPR